MKYKRGILEMTLEGVELRVRGRNKEGKHLVAATLVYPRPGIAEKVAIKTVSLKDGEAKLGTAGWRERILFKEVVEGPFALSIEVSEAMTDSAAAEALEELASSVLKVAGGEIADAAAGPWGGALLGMPIRYFSRLVSGSKKTGPDSIGSGAADLCADDGWPVDKQKKMKIPLVAERDVYEVRRTVRGGSPRGSRKRILKKGEDNGSITLGLRLYD